jgi:hypothetical protein
MLPPFHKKFPTVAHEFGSPRGGLTLVKEHFAACPWKCPFLGHEPRNLDPSMSSEDAKEVNEWI